MTFLRRRGVPRVVEPCAGCRLRFLNGRCHQDAVIDASTTGDVPAYTAACRLNCVLCFWRVTYTVVIRAARLHVQSRPALISACSNRTLNDGKKDDPCASEVVGSLTEVNHAIARLSNCNILAALHHNRAVGSELVVSGTIIRSLFQKYLLMTSRHSE